MLNRAKIRAVEDSAKAEVVRWDDARAVEWTAVIVLSYVYVNGLEDMQCYAGLNLTLRDDRQVWRANIMPAAMPGGAQSIQPTADTRSSFIVQ